MLWVFFGIATGYSTLQEDPPTSPTKNTIGQNPTTGVERGNVGAGPGAQRNRHGKETKKHGSEKRQKHTEMGTDVTMSGRK